uniref:Odorant receptor n=1 Tax=Trichogramma kaykai TaxID=54128 RepID=A0ABD2VTV9_9HYME
MDDDVEAAVEEAAAFLERGLERDRTVFSVITCEAESKTTIWFSNIVHDASNILIFGILIGTTFIVVLTASSTIILMETDLTGSTKMLSTFCVTMCAISFVCFPSQMLKNATDDLMFTCYKMNRQSYLAKIRKMLLFIMVRTMKPFVLTAGPTIELNLETCSTVSLFSFLLHEIF